MVEFVYYFLSNRKRGPCVCEVLFLLVFFYKDKDRGGSSLNLMIGLECIALGVGILFNISLKCRRF